MKNKAQFDLIIIGSGPSGVHAAKQALQNGIKVALIDIGYTSNLYQNLIPEKSFSEIRKSDVSQYRYFLGDHFEGVQVGGPKNVPHITPPRSYMLTNADKFFPIESKNFFPIQSTALGGLAASWGANCFLFNDSELKKTGIGANEIHSYYQKAAHEIGLSGNLTDDTSPYLASGLDPSSVQPPLEIDSNCGLVLKKYLEKSETLKKQGFFLGRSLLAVLSQDKEGRSANPYFDMDYWTDSKKSIYRPEYTLQDLKLDPNFTYLSERFVELFEDHDYSVSVFCRNIRNNIFETFYSKKLILAGGAINSARLAASSLQFYNLNTPILCNANRKLAAVNLRMLGRPDRDSRYSFSQLTALMRKIEAPDDYLVGQFFSYRSLFYFRIIQEIAAPSWLSLQFVRAIASALTMVNIHHSDTLTKNKTLMLEKTGSRDRLKVSYELSDSEISFQRKNEKNFEKKLITLGVLPLKTSYSEHGGSVHYAGTLPYSNQEKPLCCDSNSRLHFTKNVYLADSSPWLFLPAKGLTFTLMANAKRVAQQVAQDLENELNLGKAA